MKETRRPADSTTPTRPANDETTNSPHPLEQAQTTYNKASQDLNVILYLVTEKPAQLLVPKHEEDTVFLDNGQMARPELESKF